MGSAAVFPQSQAIQVSISFAGKGDFGWPGYGRVFKGIGIGHDTETRYGRRDRTGQEGPNFGAHIIAGPGPVSLSRRGRI